MGVGVGGERVWESAEVSARVGVGGERAPGRARAYLRFSSWFIWVGFSSVLISPCLFVVFWGMYDLPGYLFFPSLSLEFLIYLFCSFLISSSSASSSPWRTPSPTARKALTSEVQRWSGDLELIPLSQTLNWSNNGNGMNSRYSPKRYTRSPSRGEVLPIHHTLAAGEGM